MALEASYIIAEGIIEMTPPEVFLYLEDQGISADQYLDILLEIGDEIFKDSLRSMKNADVWLNDFSKKWDEYLMCEDNAYFLASAMRGINIVDEGPQIRLTWWNIELALLFDVHPVNSLNISRGQGKSWFCILRYMFLMYRYRKKKGSRFTKYSMAENLLIFGGDGLVKQHIRQMTSWIEGNYVIWKRLGDGKAYEASNTIIRTANGAQVVAKSLMSAARGYRGSLFVDDYNLEEYNYNTEVQDKVYDRITKALFPIASNPFSQIIMAATPVSPTDLIQRIWKDGGDKIMKWEYRAIEADGTILDPNLQDLDRLLERRQTYSKRAFLQEVLLIADIEIDRIFTREILEKTKDDSYSYVEFFKDFEYAERTETAVMGADYSFSTSDESDYNVFSSLAWTVDIFDEGLFRLYNLFIKQVMSVPEQCRTVHELYHKLAINMVYSESNGMQTSISQQLIDMGLNVQKMNTNQKFKLNAVSGIPVLATVMDMGYMKFPYKTEEDKKTTDMVINQFYGMIVREERGKTTKFEASAGNHDDIVLSISQAVLGSKIIDKLNLVNGSEADEWNRNIERQQAQQAALEAFNRSQLEGK